MLILDFSTKFMLFVPFFEQPPFQGIVIFMLVGASLSSEISLLSEEFMYVVIQFV